MDDSARDTLVEWREWGPEAFEEAAERGCPLLLSLSAPWCVSCHEMDRTTYAEPRIAAHLSDGFVPVRVDVDRHPRVRDRYNMGGFPSTVFLTPEGELLTGATALGIDGLRQVLDSVRRTWDAEGAEAGRVPRALREAEFPAGDLAAVEGAMVEQIAASFDEQYGGWGADAKFPLPSAVEFALSRDLDRATRTLEAIHAHLYDTYDGGFYRYAESRDWSRLHREKLLDDTAALLRAFANGYLHTGRETYRDAAEGTVDYLVTDLWAGEAFAGSQAGGDYYTLEAAEREAADPPAVDETAFADRNGVAVDALLRFAAYTDHEGARRYAERALATLRDLTDDGVVAHARSPDGEVTSERGLLVDQARVCRGFATAAQVVDPGYVADARAVADHALDALREDGPCRDGPPTGPGLLDRPLYPLDTNADLADALVDLAALTGESRYRTAAREILSAFAGAADRMGVEVAGYATAAARAADPPLVVETPAPGSDLHRAAWRLADHEKAIVPADVETATVRRGGDVVATADDPAALETAVGE
ncbi:MAG: DUF255 domain-containing protein [Haloarculaceae archaeon]